MLDGNARLAAHGGRLCIARALHPHVRQWIDLSTGINPQPYPAPRASATARARLPEPQQLEALEAAAAHAFGVDDATRVVAVAGSEAALRLLPYVLRASEAIVVGPTYASHTDAWQQAGTHVTHVDDGDDRKEVARRGQREGGACGPSVLTLVNPNNPDGRITARDDVRRLHDELDGFVLIDEAFADVAPMCSVADLAGSERYPRLIVLRSFGKFYGLAGLRLGFVIAAPPIVAQLRSLLGDWPVTADAIVAGRAAYADTAWAERTRARLQRAARRLDALLVRAGFGIVGGTSLFVLAHSETAHAHFQQLLRAGILVRPFIHDPSLLRFGLPHGAAAWKRLREALETAP